MLCKRHSTHPTCCLKCTPWVDNSPVPLTWSLHHSSAHSCTSQSGSACCRLTHNGHRNAVHLNDVFFAVHAALLASLTLIQCFVYERGTQKVSRLCAAAIGFTLTASCVSFLLVLLDNQKYPLLTFLYWLSWVKMGVTFFKYMPQVCTCTCA